MFYPTDDPIRDFHAYEAEVERMLSRLPICYNCGEPIQDEYLYNFRGQLWCERCIEHRHEATEYHMEEVR